MIAISEQMARARTQAVVDFLLNGSTGNPKAQVYSGLRPAFGAQPTGDLLVEIPLQRPLGTLADSGILTLAATDEAMVVNSGNAAWVRIIAASGSLAWDCDVSDSSGAGDLRMQSTTLYAGGFARITGGTIR